MKFDYLTNLELKILELDEDMSYNVDRYENNS